MLHDDDLELVRAARGRVKAEAGLPPQPKDHSASVVYIVGTKSMFRSTPVKFDKPLHTGQIIVLDTPSSQRMGVIDDQIVVIIEIPDTPDSIQVVDRIHERIQLYVLIGAWATTRLFNQIVRNVAILAIQEIRLERARRILAGGASAARQFRAFKRRARVEQSVRSRRIRQARLVRKAKSPIRLVGFVSGKLILKAFLLVGIAIDIVIVSLRIGRGAQRAGLPGAIAGGIAGVVDALTLGLIEDRINLLEVNIEVSVRVGASSLSGAT